MNSFKFINKVKSIFSKTTKQPLSLAPAPQAMANNVSSPIYENPKPILAQSPVLIPQVPVMPPSTSSVLPSSLRPELPASDDNSLESYGLSSCAASDGDDELLKARLKIVAKNYTIEAYLSQEDTKSEYAQSIDQTNYKIIELNIKIANIQNEQIPEQNLAIEEYKQQMNSIQSIALENETVLPQSYTIMQLAVSNAKEGISRLKQKIQAYNSEIEQKKYYIETLNKKTSELNLLNPDILKRRMNIFFSGWVRGLQGIGWNDVQIQTHKQIFIEFENSHHHMEQKGMMVDA
ncbi:MAG: hypothetical protein B7C24_17385 [Bacteroidetes bacterium 4572_77]|nr:MAG: hypothetical protein B7C24_17385 [Bacteroidetes bacterium 4572_77]